MADLAEVVELVGLVELVGEAAAAEGSFVPVVLGGVVAAVIGGVASFVGTHLNLRRSLRVENDRYWSSRLHEAAADLVASYGVSRSNWVRARSAGESQPDDFGLPDEQRRDAQARLFTLPDGDGLRDAAADLRAAMDRLAEAYHGSDDEWRQALNEQMAAMRRFQRRTRELLNSRSKV